MTSKTPPHSEEAEKGFLGACLLNATEVLPMASGVSPDDFWIPAHGLIWGAITTLSEKGMSVDSLTVHDQLKKTKELDKVGGPEGIDDLIDACTTPSYAPAYLKLLKEKAQLRKILHACMNAQHTIMHEGDDDPEMILNGIQETLFDCSRVQEATLTHGEAANILINRFKDAAKGIKPGLPCFLPQVEPFLGVFKYAGLYMFASEPGLGKTTFLQQQLKYWAKRGAPVAGVSLEMRLEDFFGRILCEEADVSMFALEQGVPDYPGSDSRLTKFRNACKQWLDEDGKSVYPLYLSDKRMNVVELCSWIRMMHKRHGIKAVGIDYLQLLHAPSSNRSLKSEAERIAYTVDMLRDLAKELNIVILVMAQISKEARQAVKGAGKEKKRRPTASDIRGSSVIEDAAWGIFMLYRWTDPETEHEDIILDLVKHRSGMLGAIKLDFIRNRQRMKGIGAVVQ